MGAVNYGNPQHPTSFEPVQTYADKALEARFEKLAKISDLKCDIAALIQSMLVINILLSRQGQTISRSALQSFIEEQSEQTRVNVGLYNNRAVYAFTIASAIISIAGPVISATGIHNAIVAGGDPQVVQNSISEWQVANGVFTGLSTFLDNAGRLYRQEAVDGAHELGQHKYTHLALVLEAAKHDDQTQAGQISQGRQEVSNLDRESHSVASEILNSR